MVNVLIVGHGAREHVIAETLKKDGAKIYAFMKSKNPGITDLSEDINLGNLNDFDSLNNFINGKNMDFAFIGPESPLANGIVDFLEKKDLPCIGPHKSVARLESSKIFTRNLMKKYNIEGNAEYEILDSMDDIIPFLDKLEDQVAVKPDGLTGGKGVKVYGDHLKNRSEIKEYCQKLLSKDGKLVIEEKLVGEEYTLQSFVDGNSLIGMPLVQDHKRAYNGDEGPNTGGMGSYSFDTHLLPFVSREIYEKSVKIMKNTIDAVKKETKIKYKGILYGQFMLTKKGPKLVEYNVRFGDPEAMNVLPLLKTNFVDICEKIISGSLHKMKIQFENKATVCKYLAPKGYPIDPKPTDVSVDTKNIKKLGGKIYYASVDLKNNKIKTTTSRSLAILGINKKISKAEEIAEKSISYIKGNLFHRSDVGTQKLINKRIKHMDSILDK
ncbi:MAG: phosphoribosylamine--glycine ligase [Candidatus Lokiarchaeota archaeon]|nr:phosphoribosylamine--glycine ligase [Candidatus Lokiarchaeota archaeon]